MPQAFDDLERDKRRQGHGGSGHLYRAPIRPPSDRRTLKSWNVFRISDAHRVSVVYHSRMKTILHFSLEGNGGSALVWLWPRPWKTEWLLSWWTLDFRFCSGGCRLRYFFGSCRAAARLVWNEWSRWAFGCHYRWRLLWPSQFTSSPSPYHHHTITITATVSIIISSSSS